MFSTPPPKKKKYFLNFLQHKITNSYARKLIRMQCLVPELYFAGYTYAGCPSGWAGYGSNCYRLFTGALEWSLAARDCQRYGANLVSIESSGEQYFVESMYTFLYWYQHIERTVCWEIVIFASFVPPPLILGVKYRCSLKLLKNNFFLLCGGGGPHSNREILHLF